MTRAAAVKSFAIVAAGLGGLAAMAAPAQTSVTASATGARVIVEDNYFDPRSVTIDSGESVKWVWKGDARHNVIFRKVPAGASKPRIKARSGGKASRSFDTPGVYRYVCTLFDGMEGSLTVADDE